MTKIKEPATATGVTVAVPAVYADMVSATDCGEVIVLSFFGLGAGNGGVVREAPVASVALPRRIAIGLHEAIANAVQAKDLIARSSGSRN